MRTMPPSEEHPHLVVVANRLPIHRVRRASGHAWEASPGGLASAMASLLDDEGPLANRRATTTWVGTPGTPEDEVPDRWHDITLAPVAAPKAAYDAFYDGLSNSTLWPLYHDAVRAPQYRRDWWRGYAEINRIFATRTAEVAPQCATVWIHDYHFHLVPALLRAMRPDLRIGFFLHIPFPDQTLFAHLPWRSEIIEGTLGADVIGLQTSLASMSFGIAAARFGGASPEQGGVVVKHGHRSRIAAYPISIDAKRFDTLARDPRVAARAKQYRDRVGGRTVIAGVDRLDYTKGIDQRLRAYRQMLRSGLVSPSEVVMVQSSVPTRERANEYSKLRSLVSELIGEINGEFGEIGRSAVHGLHRNLGPIDLAALYRAADVMVVTPFRDGMNLIAKEYIATRYDDTGALVLSEFTGAALELPQALLVNPHDRDALAATMARAVRMEAPERAARMAAMRARVHDHDVAHWANAFLGDLEA